jgi:hypothetical protein
VASPEALLLAVSGMTTSNVWSVRTLMPDAGVTCNSPFADYYPMTLTGGGTALYFGGDGGCIYRTALSGTYPVVPAPIAKGQPPNNIGVPSPIATDGTRVFYVVGNQIFSHALGGGAETALATETGAVTSLLADGGYVYWACSSCGTVARVPAIGGATHRYASAQPSPSCLAVDATRLYWGATGSIRYMNK